MGVESRGGRCAGVFVRGQLWQPVGRCALALQSPAFAGPLDSQRASAQEAGEAAWQHWWAPLAHPTTPAHPLPPQLTPSHHSSPHDAGSLHPTTAHPSHHSSPHKVDQPGHLAVGGARVCQPAGRLQCIHQPLDSLVAVAAVRRLQPAGRQDGRQGRRASRHVRTGVQAGRRVWSGVQAAGRRCRQALPPPRSPPAPTRSQRPWLGPHTRAAAQRRPACGPQQRTHRGRMMTTGRPSRSGSSSTNSLPRAPSCLMASLVG